MERTDLREKELERIIERSVDDSVERAFKKYGKRLGHSRRNILGLIIIIAAVVGVALLVQSKLETNHRVDPVENHDLTLENTGIFGFKVADFEEPILGQATRQRLLIVEEQEAYINTTVTDTGLFNLGVFNKQQALTIYGTGQYTIDLAQIKSEDISLNEDTYELTIRIPHAELRNVDYNPQKTEIGDLQKGWLAVGSIKLSAEEQNAVEVEAEERLSAELSKAERLEEADRFAKLSAYETYQPIVRTVSPAYKVVIEFQ